MKQIIFSISIVFFLGIVNVQGQDTMYVHQTGGIVTKIAVSKIDSIVFYNTSIITPPTGIVTDFEGNNYKTITLGTQTWMTENLKVTKYNNGTAIPNITDTTVWGKLTSGAQCDYNNTPSNTDVYGKLYNGYAVNTGKLCPTGWHIPSNSDWETLQNDLVANGFNYDGSTTADYIAKAMATSTGWATSTSIGATGNYPSTNNKSGFNALPSGERDGYSNYSYLGIGGESIWWSSSMYQIGNNSSIYVYAYGLKYNDNSLGQYPAKSMNSGLSVRCLRDDHTTGIVLPSVTTQTITAITQTTATSGGSVTYNGSAPIMANGICWSSSQNPTITDSITTDSQLVGFISNLTGLIPNTIYYVRAYATNSKGTAYGAQQTFTTTSTIVTDYDGNKYNTVTIGTQAWLQQNLKVTKYNDGTTIPNITDSTKWINLTSEAVCSYKNTTDTSSISTYGRLYNWYAVNTGKLCPSGWHVPSDSEWNILDGYLQNNEGGKLKEAGTMHWNTPNAGATNETKFTALPGGIRNRTGQFFAIGNDGYWWSSNSYDSSNGGYRGLSFFDSFITFSNGIYKVSGLSVRCLRN